jgi:hypothetical protein
MSGCEWATPPPQIMYDAVALKKKKGPALQDLLEHEA